MERALVERCRLWSHDPDGTCPVCGEPLTVTMGRFNICQCGFGAEVEGKEVRDMIYMEHVPFDKKGDNHVGS